MLQSYLIFAIMILFQSHQSGLQPTAKTDPFEKISITGPVDVQLVLGDSEKVEMATTGDKKTSVEVVGKTLYIRSDDKSRGPAITVYYKKLSALTVDGSGDVICTTAIRADHFDLTTKGNNGWIKLNDIHVEHIDITITGNKNLELTGSARSKNFNIMGSGRHLFKLSSPS